MVDQEISKHRVAEGPGDERYHHRVSQGPGAAQPTESAKDSGHYHFQKCPRGSHGRRHGAMAAILLRRSTTAWPRIPWRSAVLISLAGSLACTLAAVRANN